MTSEVVKKKIHDPLSQVENKWTETISTTVKKSGCPPFKDIEK